MTAKKMADIFFGKFSELISSEKVTDDKDLNEEKEIKVEEPKKVSNDINKKILIYVSGAILLGILIFFSI